MHLAIPVLICAFAACSGDAGKENGTVPVITWAGVPADRSAEVFPMLRECGIDCHLGLYGNSAEALAALEAADKAGIGLIPGFPGIKDSTETVVASMKDSPALVAWHLKDEPELSDIPWIAELVSKVESLDSLHPPYVNLYPDWAWGGDDYAENIETFASRVDVPFYSFDQYPVTEKDGRIEIRPTWYRNLEVFSAMARRHGKPFWAFALTASHHLGAPSPPAFYPVPTIGHLRLQVFGNLLYGAQAIQYFTAGGLYDERTLEKTPVFDIVRQVNAEIKAYSPVFLGCSIEGVWHTGDTVPFHTVRLDSMPHPSVKSLSVSGEGGVVSLIANDCHWYLAIQNRDSEHDARLDISFAGKTWLFTPAGPVKYDGRPVTLPAGGIAVFGLGKIR